MNPSDSSASNPPLIISAKDFDLTPSLKEYVNEKLGKLYRFSRHISKIAVELDIDHGHQHGRINRIEVWVTVAGAVLQAGHRAEHMHEAIDLVYPKIERQVVDHERKTRDQHRPSRI